MAIETREQDNGRGCQGGSRPAIAGVAVFANASLNGGAVVSLLTLSGHRAAQRGRRLREPCPSAMLSFHPLREMAIRRGIDKGRLSSRGEAREARCFALRCTE